MIHVVLASNRNYFLGLFATAASLVDSNRSNAFLIHIIDGGLSQRQQQLLAERLARSNASNRIVFHPLDGRVFAGFKTDYGNSYMTYARIVMASFVDADRVIYLDTDLLIAADVRPLWETALGGCIVAAAPDRDIRYVKDDYPFDTACGDARYFNAGVMVIDLVQWRARGIQATLLQMITAQPDKFRWWDQTAMNAIFQGQVVLLDPSWNTFADSVSFSKDSAGRIFHYVGGTKPWTRYLDTPEFQLWRRFYRRHAGSGGSLYFNWRMLGSYAQHLRHRTLSRSSALQAAAALLLSTRAAVRGHDGAAAARDFRSRHSGVATAPDRAVATREIDAFIQKRWGEPEDSLADADR